MENDDVPADDAVEPAGRGLKALGALVVLMLAAVAIAAYVKRDHASSTPTARTYVQTWAKDYAATTCDDWKQSMTFDQRRAAAGEMLSGIRTGQGEPSPTDEVVLHFSDDIENTCGVLADPSSRDIAHIAAGVFVAFRAQYSG